LEKYQGECRANLEDHSVYDDDVDRYNHNVIEMINQAAQRSMPKKHCGRKGKQKPLPYWNESIKQAIYARNCARNRLSRAKTQENVDTYKRLKREAQHIIKETAKSYWHGFCDTIDGSTKLSTVWNMAKRMNGKQSSVSSKHLIRENGQTVDRNAEKGLTARTQVRAS